MKQLDAFWLVHNSISMSPIRSLNIGGQMYAGMPAQQPWKQKTITNRIIEALDRVLPAQVEIDQGYAVTRIMLCLPVTQIDIETRRAHHIFAVEVNHEEHPYTSPDTPTWLVRP